MTSTWRSARAAFSAWLLLGLSTLSATGPAHAHEGGLGNAVMWHACDGRQIDQPCVFQSLEHDVFRGSCQSMSNALVCVRNQPIEWAANGAHHHAHDPAPSATPGVTTDGWPWLSSALAWLVGGLGIGLSLGLARAKIKRKTAAAQRLKLKLRLRP